MLRITIPSSELWDDERQEFVSSREQKLQLEHSLVSISKWESKWHKPFISKEEKTPEETIDYVRCMTLTQNVDPEIYRHLTNENMRKINDYIDDSMTATWFSEWQRGKGGSEQVTSELIYYWLTALNIPYETQKWHLNRLLTLIRICEIKNQPNKKMNRKETYSRYRALNEARKKRLNTKG